MDKDSRKFSKALLEIVNRLEENEKVDVLVYIRQPAENFDGYLQTQQEQGKLRFNFLKFANCYVVEAPKELLIEIAKREDVLRIDVNPRFGVSHR